MQYIQYIFVFILLVLLELIYFKIAQRFKINDKPNSRSSHNEVTILGGGIIFYISILIFFLLNDFQYPLFFTGLSFIVVISFYDDLRPQSFRVRLLTQLLAVLLMLADLALLQPGSLLYAGIWLIVSVGILNAYNFMDGINGMLALFSIVLVTILFYVNRFVIPFINESIIIYLFFSLLIFGFFNVRQRAFCFSGDVGSVAMGFISIFLVGTLILKSGNFAWIGLLTVFGIDPSLTLLYRVYSRENITIPHRKHLFQLLVNEKKMPQPAVSIIYTSIQLIISIALIALIDKQLYAWILIVSSVIVLSLIYAFLRKKLILLHIPQEVKR